MSFFSRDEELSVAALCAGAALLAGVAIFLNGADLKAIVNSPAATAASVLSLFDSGANAAATALGDAQGVPPNFTGQTYPDYTSCWIVLDGKFGSRGPNCAGASNWAPAYSFFSGIFSLNPTGSTNGKSVYVKSTWVPTGFAEGPLLGPPFSTLGCPDGTTMVVTGADDNGNPTSGDCYSGGTSPNGREGFGGPSPTYAGPATYCYSDTSGGGPVGMGGGRFTGDANMGGGGGTPATYSFPAGYSLANGDKLDTAGGGAAGDANSAFNKRGGGDGQCHAWKYTLQHIDSTPVTVGTVPTVAPGTPLTLQWSCLPSRQVEVGYCHYDQWNSHCWKESYVLYRINPLASGVSGNGQNFVSGTNITDTKTITAPATAGTYTYSLSCSGGQYPLPAMTVDITVSGQPATPQLSLAPAASTIAYNGTQTLTYSATGGAGYDACYLSGGQWGSNPGTPVGTSGSVTTNPLTSDKQYSYICHNTDPSYPNNGWVAPVTANVTVNPPQPVCTGAHEINPPACTCETGYVRQNGVCVLPNPQCAGAHEVNYPACNCDIGYVKQNGVCVLPTTCSDPRAVPPLCSSCISGYETKNGICVPIPPAMSLSAAPLRVQKGNSSTVTWSVTGLISGAGTACSITSNPAGVFSKSMPANTAPTWSGSVQTGAINGSSIITLSCTGATPKSVTVGIIPVFIEI